MTTQEYRHVAIAIDRKFIRGMEEEVDDDEEEEDEVEEREPAVIREPDIDE
jgi:hypothetical protein